MHFHGNVCPVQVQVLGGSRQNTAQFHPSGIGSGYL
jgi:hypothetical protein